MNSSQKTSRTSSRPPTKKAVRSSGGTTAVPWPFPQFPPQPHHPPPDRALLGSGRSTMTELMTDVGPSPF